MSLSPPNPKAFENVEKALTAQIVDRKTPSIQYSFFDNYHVIYQFSRGFSDIRNKRTVKPTTSFNAHSLTKTFTALAIVQLEERGLININHYIAQYLPSFPYDKKVTVKQVLTHTAAIPNPLPLSWIHLPEEHKSFSSREFFNGIFQKNRILKTRPGEKYGYSNLGYVILGQMIEEVSGLTYENFILQNIIKQLDLPKGSLAFDIIDSEKHAVGYQKWCTVTNLALSFLLNKKKFMGAREGIWKPFKPLYVNGDSYGGLIGTSEGFIKYLQEFLKTDSKLISCKTKELLFTEQMIAGKPTGMCLSWFTGCLNGQCYYMHAGGGGGFYSEIRLYPAIGKGSLIAFNRTGITNEYFLNKIDKFVVTGEAG